VKLSEIVHFLPYFASISLLHSIARKYSRFILCLVVISTVKKHTLKAAVIANCVCKYNLPVATYSEFWPTRIHFKTVSFSFPNKNSVSESSILPRSSVLDQFQAKVQLEHIKGMY